MPSPNGARWKCAARARCISNATSAASPRSRSSRLANATPARPAPAQPSGLIPRSSRTMSISSLKHSPSVSARWRLSPGRWKSGWWMNAATRRWRSSLKAAFDPSSATSTATALPCTRFFMPKRKWTILALKWQSSSPMPTMNPSIRSPTPSTRWMAAPI